MTRTRTRSFALVAGVLLLTAACSDSKKISGADSSSTSSSVAVSSTTVVESTTTTGPETTVAVTTVPATVPATPAPTIPAPTGTVLGQPTNLQYATGESVVLDDGFLCGTGDPGIPGWTVDDCQQAPTIYGDVTTLVTHRNDDGRFAVFVLFHREGYLRAVLEAYEPGPGTWSGVTVELGDHDSDGSAEVWVGYRYAGTGQYLDLDVVMPLPEADFPATTSYFLGGLQSLDHGVIDMHPGGATVQRAIYGASDPGCCPSQFLQQEITSAGTEWRIDAGVTYPAASTPPLTGDL